MNKLFVVIANNPIKFFSYLFNFENEHETISHTQNPTTAFNSQQTIIKIPLMISNPSAG